MRFASALFFTAALAAQLVVNRPKPEISGGPDLFTGITSGSAIARVTPTSISKTLEIKDHYYLIDFSYDASYSSVPATYPPGVAHYRSEIKASEVINGNRTQIGKPFYGVFTNGECTEDEPTAIVEEALKATNTLTPAVLASLEAKRKTLSFEKLPLYELWETGVLIVTPHGARDIKEIRVGDKTIWKK